jgi:hypothetical protein
MAELVVGAITALSSVASTVATTVGSTVATVGTALTGTTVASGGVIPTIMSGLGMVGTVGSLALSVMQGGATAFQASSQLSAGKRAMSSGMEQFQYDQARASNEELSGEQKIGDLKAKLARDQANMMVAHAASGLDVSAGEPVDAARRAEDDTNRQIDVERSNASLRAYARRRAAKQALNAGFAAREAAGVQAAGSVAKWAIQDIARGTVKPSQNPMEEE